MIKNSEEDVIQGGWYLLSSVKMSGIFLNQFRLINLPSNGELCGIGEKV